MKIRGIPLKFMVPWISMDCMEIHGISLKFMDCIETHGFHENPWNSIEIHGSMDIHGTMNFNGIPRIFMESMHFKEIPWISMQSIDIHGTMNFNGIPRIF